MKFMHKRLKSTYIIKKKFINKKLPYINIQITLIKFI